MKTRGSLQPRPLVAAVAAPLVMTFALSLAFGIGTSGCASDSAARFDSEPGIEGPQTDGAAYAAEGFTFRKPMTRRRPNDYSFFFKHCDLIDQHDFYSATSYGCAYP